MTYKLIIRILFGHMLHVDATLPLDHEQRLATLVHSSFRDCLISTLAVFVLGLYTPEEL
jgi:hypothetical protein